jgi:hypothetical protein
VQDGLTWNGGRGPSACAVCRPQLTFEHWQGRHRLIRGRRTRWCREVASRRPLTLSWDRCSKTGQKRPRITLCRLTLRRLAISAKVAFLNDGSWVQKVYRGAPKIPLTLRRPCRHEKRSNNYAVHSWFRVSLLGTLALLPRLAIRSALVFSERSILRLSARQV